MKRLIFIFCIVLITIPVLALDKDKSQSQTPVKLPSSISREVPDWNWHTAPQILVENFYDYFQCYKETPVSVRSDGSGVYLLYRAKNADGISSLYYSYVNDAGAIEETEELGYSGYYPDSFIDDYSHDVFVSWHGEVSDSYGCVLLYDLYHLNGEIGQWKENPVLIIDPANTQIFPNPEDQFIWAQIATGPSPEPDQQRVYLYAYNCAASTGSVSLPSENLLLCYADYTQDDLSSQSNLEWEYTTIPQLDDYHNETPYWARPQVSLCVIDNKVIAAGFLERDNAPTELICLVNENYGEGEWTEFNQPWEFEVENLIYYLPGNPAPHYIFNYVAHNVIMFSRNFNVVPANNNQEITWSGVMGIVDSFNSVFVSEWKMIYPKTFRFDLENEEFGFCDIYPQGADPSDENLMHPFDLDEDGEVDEFDDQNNPLWAQDWPFFYNDPEQLFFYNQYYLSSNPEEGWLAYIWVDGTNLKRADEGMAGYEDWAETPEIAIVFSEDNGTTWYDPIFINGNPQSENYCPHLEGMIPCFLYPGDKITAGDDDTALLHLFFINDYAYGSNHMGGTSPNAGAEFVYASIELGLTAKETGDEVAANVLMCRNYPNPFNPVTTIEFELAEAGGVTIDVYNAKGQKVDTILSRELTAGLQKINWNAPEAPAGIYYYKISSNGHNNFGRMVLLK